MTSVYKHLALTNYDSIYACCFSQKRQLLACGYSSIMPFCIQQMIHSFESPRDFTAKIPYKIKTTKLSDGNDLKFIYNKNLYVTMGFKIQNNAISFTMQFAIKQDAADDGFKIEKDYIDGNVYYELTDHSYKLILEITKDTDICGILTNSNNLLYPSVVVEGKVNTHWGDQYTLNNLNTKNIQNVRISIALWIHQSTKRNKLLNFCKQIQINLANIKSIVDRYPGAIHLKQKLKGKSKKYGYNFLSNLIQNASKVQIETLYFWILDQQ